MQSLVRAVLLVSCAIACRATPATTDPGSRTPEDFIVRVSWEEAGIASRTVRACAEPRSPHYTGSGDPLDATNWECR